VVKRLDLAVGRVRVIPQVAAYDGKLVVAILYTWLE
jgi:hypothetical protein